MQLVISRTTPIYAPSASSGVFVQWDVTQVPTGSSDLSFKLERAGGPEGPFEVVMDGIQDYHFFDKHLESTTPSREAQNLLSFHRDLYYRVTATAGATTVTNLRVVGDGLPRRQMLLRRKMQRDFSVALRVGSGVPLAILKRRHWGCRCTACFDRLTKAVTNSKCTTCFGTGYVSGYHTPVKILGKKGTTAPDVQVAPHGRVETNNIELTILDYPLLAVDDVIAELNTDRRYVVNKVTRTELRGVPVHTKLSMSELARDSIEYRLPIQTGHIPTLY